MDAPERLIWTLILLLLLAFVGLAVILALLAAWRNHSHRQRWLDQGKHLREAYRGDAPEPGDVWSESANRYREKNDPPSDAADTGPSDLDKNNDEDDDDRPPQR